MFNEESPDITESDLTALKRKYLCITPKVIKIIYDQSLFHLPEREQKDKFDAGWLNRLSASDPVFILNANEDTKGQIMFL